MGHCACVLATSKLIINVISFKNERHTVTDMLVCPSLGEGSCSVSGIILYIWYLPAYSGLQFRRAVVSCPLGGTPLYVISHTDVILISVGIGQVAIWRCLCFPTSGAPRSPHAWTLHSLQTLCCSAARDCVTTFFVSRGVQGQHPPSQVVFEFFAPCSC